MLSFKQYLKENIINGSVIIYDNQEKLLNNQGEYDNSYVIENGMLPIDFSNDTIDGDVSALNCEFLTSLKNFPHTINDDLYLTRCKNLTSLEYAPQIVKSGVYIGATGITSLEGIGKNYFTTIGTEIVIPNGLKSHILGVLKIKNLRNGAYKHQDMSEDLLTAIKIINKHLKDRDITKCRHELIEVGLKEFAKL